MTDELTTHFDILVQYMDDMLTALENEGTIDGYQWARYHVRQYELTNTEKGQECMCDGPPYPVKHSGQNWYCDECGHTIFKESEEGSR